MQLIVAIGVAAFVGWIIWSTFGLQCTFEVRVSEGIPELVRGTVSHGFLQEIAEVCSRHGVTEGVVRGVKKADRIGLSFSAGVPCACQQQLRNLWNLSPRMRTPATRPRQP
jgi:hypothetical protein